MRFFKYLVFIFLTLISVSSFAANVRVYYMIDGTKPNVEFDTQEQACQAGLQSNYTYLGITNKNPEGGYCSFKNHQGNNSSYLIYSKFVNRTCTADGSAVYSGSVTVSDWANDAEYVSLTDQATLKFQNTYVCSNSCKFKYDFLSGDGDPDTGPIVFKGKYVKSTESCTSGNTSPNESLTGSGKPKSECTKAYCDKEPSKNCPDGYKQGSFNGKAICIKNSPNNPNPNDPNTPYDPNNPPDNGGDDGKCNGTNNCNTNNYEFDVSQIVNAISSQTSAITSAISQQTSALTSAISSAVSSINSTLSTGFKSVTDTLGITNTKLDATNTKLDKSNEHLKNIKENSDKANLSLDSIDKNGKDLNTKIDKTNEKLDKSNEHLDNIEDATIAASEALGEANRTLYDIKDSIDSQTKCRDQSTGKYRECTSDDLKKLGDSDTKLPTSEMGKQAFSLDLFKVSASDCPADKELNLPTMFGTISKTVSFHEVCNQTAFFGYIVLILAYSFAVVIVLRA
ncbi:virulence factor TspB C-terminal domain-related protein [Acinetobacter higginsii]|uniref:virulence factor TspB C-terminal domain-related protein n=1 Tax=Acinetobacter higginsii TaxID=70347 RepID=UPI001F4A5627|nr:virulence factor TspB C-terminal domain-related protein [Acinetobacter higginsii]MCH7341731.1 hypothetical protein [Acinetobacter higginsii]